MTLEEMKARWPLFKFEPYHNFTYDNEWVKITLEPDWEHSASMSLAIGYKYIEAFKYLDRMHEALDWKVRVEKNFRR